LPNKELHRGNGRDKIGEYPWGVFASDDIERKLMQNNLRLSIEGMHCGGCVRRVTAALQGVKGVELGPVEAGSAEMTFHPEQASAEEIAAAVNRIGFTARIQE
jgi:copper chaperone